MIDLLQEDQQIILSRTAWINDRIIDACQRLLQQGAGKDFGGFTMYFSVERGKVIQILHTGHSHWVTIITYNTVDPVVCVYDSKFDVPSSHLSAQLACLLMT